MLTGVRSGAGDGWDGLVKRHATLPVGVDWMFALLSDVYLAQHEAAEAADVDTVASALALVTTLESVVPDVLDAADDGASPFVPSLTGDGDREP